jgi:hypothetical protein
MMNPSLTLLNSLETFRIDAFIWQFQGDLTSLALDGSCSSIKEKFEHYEFLTVNQLLQKHVVVESHLKYYHDVHRSHPPNMHATEYHSNRSDDETKQCCFAEFIWHAQKNIHLSISQADSQESEEDVSLLVIPLNLTVYLMNFLKMITLNCHMLCHHLKN